MQILSYSVRTALGECFILNVNEASSKQIKSKQKEEI